MSDREDLRAYARALYPLGALLSILPLIDMTMRARPFRPGAPEWRFAAFGTLFGNVGTVLIGLALVGAVAAYRRSGLLLRVLAVVAFVAGAVVVALLALFVLDALQVRRTAPEAVQSAIGTSAVSACAAALLGTIALLSLGAGAWSASRGDGGRRAGKRGERPVAPNPMVVQSAMTGGKAK